MFSSRTRNILIFFDICGFNTRLTNLSNNQKLSFLVNLVQILLAISLMLFKFFTVRILFFSLGTMETINEYIEYSSSLYAYWLIIWDSIQYRQQNKLFWAFHQKQETYMNQHSNFRCYFLKLYEFFIARIIITLIKIVSDRISTSGFKISLAGYIAYTIPVFLCQMRLFYYLFCVEIIDSHLKNIEFELKLLKHSNENSICLSELHRLKWIRRYYNNVYEMVNILNEIFGWSQAASILFCFYSTFTDFNYFYIHFHNLSLLNACSMFSKIFLTFLQSNYVILFHYFTISGGIIWATRSPLLIIYFSYGSTKCLFRV